MKIAIKSVIAASWLLGAAWIFIPHRHEGRVVLVISDRLGWGIHRNDPLGILGPLVVTVLGLAVEMRARGRR